MRELVDGVGTAGRLIPRFGFFRQFKQDASFLAHNRGVRANRPHELGDRSVSRATAVLLSLLCFRDPIAFVFYVFF